MSNNIDAIGVPGNVNVEPLLALAAVSIGSSARLLERQLVFAKVVLHDSGSRAIELLNPGGSGEPSGMVARFDTHVQRLLDFSSDYLDILLHTQKGTALALGTSAGILLPAASVESKSE